MQHTVNKKFMSRITSSSTRSYPIPRSGYPCLKVSFPSLHRIEERVKLQKRAYGFVGPCHYFLPSSLSIYKSAHFSPLIPAISYNDNHVNNYSNCKKRQLYPQYCYASCSNYSTTASTMHSASTVSFDSNNSSPPFQKILIANRGEIARRIIKTCHKLNIQTVAIYSTADSKSPHVQEADEAVCVGPTASSESYLNVDNVSHAIKQTNADAIHPGYGFLSENAHFCKVVEELGVKFIGPNSDAIIAMGDKITSKQIAKNANVNIIPGYDGFVTSQSHAVEIANSIGYPVMIKATSGGGGKGMRICYTDDQVKEGFVLSTAEAKSFFNDERLFIEKFIERPHHIEIQLLAGRRQIIDEDGNLNEGELEILCFPERECSIQRRNQKILEESPSTLLKPETRAEMIRQVKRLVREVGYTSAGTVEFLVDEDQNFYFLEMNTRLQVEHPVTEMVSGDVDLVYGMISIAAGCGIPQEYLDLVTNGYDTTNMTEKEIEGLSVPHIGHAIEVRTILLNDLPSLTLSFPITYLQHFFILFSFYRQEYTLKIQSVAFYLLQDHF